MRRTGFTIIELLVVIVLIGLLTSVAASSFVVAQRHSRDSARKSDVNSIAAAVESYYSLTKQFPGKQPAQGADNKYKANLQGDCETATSWTPSSGNPYGSNPVTYYAYMYDPNNTGTSACNDASRSNASQYRGVTEYTPTDYAPFPSWIPNLGDYLNPMPVERRYIGDSGTATDKAKDFLCTVSSVCTTTQTRTYVYRPLWQGYAVYARLESTSDQDIVNTDASGKIVNSLNNPQLPSNLDTLPSGSNLSVYMVRK